jgi:hypothetical protein
VTSPPCRSALTIDRPGLPRPQKSLGALLLGCLLLAACGEPLDEGSDSGPTTTALTSTTAVLATVTSGAPSSAAFAALLAPLMPDGAVLSQHSHLSSPDGFQLDEAWYQLPDGAVLLVSRNYAGPDYSIPADAVLMGRPGGVEYWEDGIQAIVSSTPDVVEIRVALDDWIITLAAQPGPVWFGEGEPPPGFFQEGRRGVIPEIAELRSLAQQIIRTEGVLDTP